MTFVSAMVKIDIERPYEVPGIGRKRVEKLRENWEKQTFYILSMNWPIKGFLRFFRHLYISIELYLLYLHSKISLLTCMDNIYMLSDAEITNRISAKIKELRLKQNISRQDMACSSGVSVSSIARMEDGEIKSFESFLRIIRSLGMIEWFLPMLQEEEISPNEYYKMVQSAKARQRKRATRRNNYNNEQEDSEW